MADTSVSITAGSGTSIDTRTEASNGNHRQVIVIGDPATNAGVAPVDVTNGLSVTLTTALPAGTAAIGKLSANSGVDIGDVDVTSSVLPTGASTSANQTTIIGHVDGIETALGTLALESGGNLAAIAASASVLDDWDETNRAAVNTIAGQVGVQGASGTVTALTQRVVLATDVALPAGTNNIGDVDVLTLPAIPAGNNNIGDVDVASIAAGNNNIGDVDIASIAAGDNNIGNVDIVTMPGVVGTIADDATTPGNPVMTGGKAVETDGTDPTSVSAEDDVAIFRTDRNRRLLVNTFHPNLWRANENHSSAQTNNQLKAAPGANLSLYITDIVISNGATAGTVKLVEDESGTPADLIGPLYLGINAGMSKKFATPIRLTANKTLGFTSTVATTHTIYVAGFTAP